MEMYNRYIPQPDGSYRRNRVQETPRPSPVKPQQTEQVQNPDPPCPVPPVDPPRKPKCAPPCRQEHGSNSKKESRRASADVGSFLRNLIPKDFDTSDLMIILLLLLMAGDCAEDQNTALLTLALYLFL